MKAGISRKMAACEKVGPGASSGTLGNLKALADALRYFRTETSPLILVPIAGAFVAVARDEGRGLWEYAALLGHNVSSTSRYFLTLTERKTPPAQRRGLMVGCENPENRRQTEYRLTKRGRQVMVDMLAHLDHWWL